VKTYEDSDGNSADAGPLNGIEVRLHEAREVSSQLRRDVEGLVLKIGRNQEPCLVQTFRLP